MGGKAPNACFRCLDGKADRQRPCKLRLDRWQEASCWPSWLACLSADRPNPFSQLTPEVEIGRYACPMRMNLSKDPVLVFSCQLIHITEGAPQHLIGPIPVWNDTR